MVVLATLVASTLLISAIDALEVVRDAVWTTFFAANVRFAAVETDYFAQDQIASPLQHYWSLAVEEQFYLLWPLILLGCVWVARRRTRRAKGPARGQVGGRGHLPRLAVFWVLCAIGVLSLAYGVILTETDRSAAYFSTPARAWELALGALAALVAPAVSRRMSAGVRAPLVSAGLTAILVSCLLYGEETPFPGVVALMPVLGTLAVLVAGAAPLPGQQDPLPVRLLSIRPMRVVGDWSYSLYLWHWPLLLIPYLRTGRELSGGSAALAVAAAFVLAGLTYRFVETPMRTARWRPLPRGLVLYPISITVVLAAALGAHSYARDSIGGDGPAITLNNSGLAESGAKVSRNETVALAQASVEAGLNHRALPAVLRPDLATLRDDVPPVGECDYDDESVRLVCPRGDPDGDKVLAVIGNSHGRMWIPAFERIALHEGYRTYYFVKPNCSAADLLISDIDNGNAPWQACSDWREWAFSQIEQIHPDLAVVSTSRPNPVIYADDGRELRQGDEGRLQVTEDGFVSTFERLRTMADRVALIRDVPKNQGDPGTCLTAGKVDLGTCMFKPLPSQEADSDVAVDAAIRTGTDHVDPRPWLCWRQHCAVVVGDTLTYRDQGHLSATYAGELGDDLGRKLGIWTD